jgi:hypothetical protein
MTLGGVGNFFQRDQTWWAQSKAWIDYTQRCQWLLQQGRPVADIAVFTGEEIPRRAVLPERLVKVLPGLMGVERVRSEAVRLANEGVLTTKSPNGVVHSANMADPADWIDPLHGYAFDSFNPDVFLRLAKIVDGRIVLPGGASYGLLVWPGRSELNPDAGGVSVAVAKRLLEMVKEGATVLIDTVGRYHSVGLANAGKDDKVVRDVFGLLLGGAGSAGIHRVGKGRVLIGPYVAASLDPIGIQPDFAAGAKGITYTHRTAPGLDIYFVSNQSDSSLYTDFSFRVTGLKPEVWEPVTGTIGEPLDWEIRSGRTLLRAYMAPRGSYFVVFRESVLPPEPLFRGNRAHTSLAMALEGKWTVRFDTAYGGPLAPVVFDSLLDWSHHPDSAIRYYSGTAVYTKSFQWDTADRAALLYLNAVANIATVWVNGIDCGTAWTAPYKLNISKALHRGTNEIRIAVSNTWANRLTGDQRLPEALRRTWTASPWKSDGMLLPAGLLGPVTIRLNSRYDFVEWGDY